MGPTALLLVLWGLGITSSDAWSPLRAPLRVLRASESPTSWPGAAIWPCARPRAAGRALVALRAGPPESVPTSGPFQDPVSADHGGGAGSNEPSDKVKAELSLLKRRGRAMAESLRGCPLYLVGMMGSGKTVVGDLLCRSMGSYSFLDTDKIIEKYTNRTVAQFFAEEGEEAFRDVESAVLATCHPHLRVVVATGGGAVVREKNWGPLHAGVVVFLDVPAATLARRLVRRHHRALPSVQPSAEAQAAAAQYTGVTPGAAAASNYTTPGAAAAAAAYEAADNGAASAPPAAHADGVGSRPLLLGLDDPSDEAAVAQRLGSILKDRAAKYQQADVTVVLRGTEALDDCVLKVFDAIELYMADNPPRWKVWKEQKAAREASEAAPKKNAWTG